MRNEKNNNKGKNMIHLKSVGAFINEETLMVSPAGINEKGIFANVNMECHLSDTTEEWNENLSHEDFMVVQNLMSKTVQSLS